VRACVHRGECSYVYEYLRLYCVSQKKNQVEIPVQDPRTIAGDGISLVLLVFVVLCMVVRRTTS
jgi:hypothetical protein